MQHTVILNQEKNNRSIEEFVICHNSPRAVLRVLNLAHAKASDLPPPHTYATTTVDGHTYRLQVEEIDTTALPADNAQCIAMLREMLLSASDFIHETKTALCN